ncbi:hypothetical protein ABEH28_13325 [Pseudomonas sp. Ps21-P2]|uniref:hypothetical protein n=1 Tax=Pseudomonas sp. Ps21-P2 TaxID=3080331 RepID=UPI003209A75F
MKKKAADVKIIKVRKRRIGINENFELPGLHVMEFMPFDLWRKSLDVNFESDIYNGRLK